MAISPNNPNSNADIEKVSRSVDYVLDALQTPGSVQEILNLATTSFGRRQGVQVRPLLGEMVKNVDRPILKGLAEEVVTLMSNWFEDPQTLCCLIQGLFAHFNATAFWTSDNVTLANTDFAKWLDLLIAFVDVIIVMLTSNIKKLSIMIPDLIKEIMSGVIGAVLLVLQEVLFAIRDSIIGMLLEEFTYRTRNWAEFSKCLPLAELIDILKKYISDYGLFAELFEKIKGHIGNMVSTWQFYKALDFPKNIKDLEFLYWFRDLLVKLKTASLSFDLCFLPQNTALGGVSAAAPTSSTVLANTPRVTSSTSGLSKAPSSSPENVQGITVAPDGTILENKEALRKGNLSVLTNSSVRGFLNKYYGYPLDVVDTLVVGGTSADSIQGSDTGGNLDLNADCPNAPDPYETIKWALRVRNRNF